MKAAKINCWEHKRCNRQPGGTLTEQLGPCPAATDTTCDGINGGKNAGRLCWAIADTSCEGKVCVSHSQKASRCRECPFFRRVMYEEGCHFQLLRPGLGISDTNVLHRKLNDIVKLVTMYRDIFACMAVRPLLERITRHAAAITCCLAAGAYLLEDPLKKLSLEADTGTIVLPTEISLDDDSPISAAIANRGTCRGTVMLPDRTEAASIIAAPIGGEQGLTGVLILVKSDGEFSIDDEWFLGEFALLAGLGIGNSRLIESLRDLREVDKAKSRVVSLLVHQIGSPLATIACSLTALLKTDDILDNADRKELLECSLNRANSIARLSEKLLDLAAIRSASYLAEVKSVYASEVLREEVEFRHAQARQAGLKAAIIDRLTLTDQRIESMAGGLEQLADQVDPVGQIIEGYVRPNGLRIEKVRVPLGVVAIIFESRPNVTCDAAGVCIRSSNACILRGGREAINSNLAIADALRAALEAADLPVDAVRLVQTTGRELVPILLKLNQYIDLVIPRGGRSLIEAVVQQSTIPVIKHYTGNCHVYVDKDCPFEMASQVVINAKCDRPGVCNAVETVLFHRDIADDYLPRICGQLVDRGVTIRGCPQTCRLFPQADPAGKQDWFTEYLDLVLAVKVVENLDQAIEHINTYGSKHTDAILTDQIAAAERFARRVDTASVMINASTRFSDGAQYGLGAEIGISTDKLHARGPMGAADLTTYKYIVRGQGHVRT